MGLLDVLRDTVDTAIGTASKMAGDRSSGSGTKSTSQKSTNGNGKKK